jgi:hypothetical protein
MAEAEREETTAPQNPPNSVLRPEVRRAALRAYLGPLVALLVGLGVGMFWASRPGPDDDDRDVPRATGTAGNTTPGGFAPETPPNSTQQEVERRGVRDTPTRNPMPDLSTRAELTELGHALERKPQDVAGKRIAVQDVTVVETSGAKQFSVRDGAATVVVIAPEGSPQVRTGQSVDLAGVVQRDERHGVRIRATRITVRN